jgi:hypothetical protein
MPTVVTPGAQARLAQAGLSPAPPTERFGLRIPRHMPPMQPALPPTPDQVSPLNWSYSRCRGGVTSFGLVGRLAITGMCVVPAYYWFQFAGAFVALPLMIWFLIGGPTIVRDTWKRERVLPAARRAK